MLDALFRLEADKQPRSCLKEYADSGHLEFCDERGGHFSSSGQSLPTFEAHSPKPDILSVIADIVNQPAGGNGGEALKGRSYCLASAR